MVTRRRRGLTVVGWVVTLAKDRRRALSMYLFRGHRMITLSSREKAFVFTGPDEARWAVKDYIARHKTPLTVSDFSAVKVEKEVDIRETVREKDWPGFEGDPLAFEPQPVEQDDALGDFLFDF